MNRIELEPVDRLEITLLMDNVTDPLLVDQEAIARMNWPKAILGGLPTAQARVSPTTGVPDALIAEPGFSALVRIEKAAGSERCCSTPACRRTGWWRTCAGSRSIRPISR